MSSVQLAAESDLEELYTLDAIAQTDEGRRNFIKNAVRQQNCYMVVDNMVVGYGILEYSFFGKGFVPLVYVHTDYRREGVGANLMHYLETICETDRLFTSTNLSNIPMQGLLAKLEYKLSGIIHDLDLHDPELIYVKYLQYNLSNHP